MSVYVLWAIGIFNAVIWFLNIIIGMSGDRSGSGMVLMLTLPISILISLISLVIVGFTT